jgi:large subunit ribosomal protein L15e
MAEKEEKPEVLAEGEAAPEAGGPSGPHNLYGHVKEAWRDLDKGYLRDLLRQRMVAWRRSPAITRVERPLRIDRARDLGYRAKQGFVVARARVRRGGLRKPAIRAGRRPKRMGINKITMAKSIQRIAEERSAKRFPNLEVLNSYWVGQDGMHKYYEVILVDPAHPAVANDPRVHWILERQHHGRVYRGLTSAGKKGRGLRHKGKGAEGLRPSRQANKGRKKPRSTGSRD